MPSKTEESPMNAQQVLQATMDTSSMVLTKYVEDLSDEDLLRRPGEGCNHLAWQLGHLIASEGMLLDSICPGAAPELPEGFAEKHSKEAVGDDNPANFCSKQEYLELMSKVRSSTVAALSKMSEEDLDAPAPEHFRKMFPTVGAVCVLLATHQMMHAGQFVPVRRAAGKGVVI
jgi:hypothetical protein